MGSNKGQITIFVILAIVIVAAIIGIFIFRDNLTFDNIDSELSPVYESFDNCVEEYTRDALAIAGTKGGYIESPVFEPGSPHAPFSSQLEFVGLGIPYWYYVSGNNLLKEQTPSKNEIESQIAAYLESQLINCDFSTFVDQGISVTKDVPEVSVDILDNRVNVDVSMDLTAEKADKNAIKSSHEIELNSNFGKLYDLAIEIYNKEKNEAFLENYTLDVLYNYAPVTGSEISCSPLIWNPQEVSEELKSGIEGNIGAIKLKGGENTNSENDYFEVDLETDENVRFIYSQEWPTRIEIWPSDNSLLVAEPIGLQEGLGVLGFCYVPYHFVYDVYHPTLIQIYNGEELFQFPVAVVIDKSTIRAPIIGESVVEDLSVNDFCSYRNTPVEVYTFDSLLNPVEARISYACFNEKCNIGNTEIFSGDAVLNGDFPQCIGGRIIAEAENYTQGELSFSTNTPGVANIIMNKIYEKDIELIIGGLDLEQRDSNGLAIINFESDNYITSVAYPNQKTVRLAEGFYNISVQVFSGSSLTIPGGITQNCVDVPSSGVLGFFGQTNEQCFTTSLPDQTITNALSAGGKTSEFILEEDLQSSNVLILSVPILPSPTSLEQLQSNYDLINNKNINLEFE